MRTWLPTISITWMEMSSPSMIFSPGRRVMISTGAAYSVSARAGGCVASCREQRGAHGGAVGLVDDLVAAAVETRIGALQVAREVLELAGGAHGDEHVTPAPSSGRPAAAVASSDSSSCVVREELPRVGDGQGELRVVGGLQPDERRCPRRCATRT